MELLQVLKVVPAMTFCPDGIYVAKRNLLIDWSNPFLPRSRYLYC